MSVTIRIMNWNIEQFGTLKACMPDIMRAIAKIVVKNKIDIVCIVEVKTTKFATAAQHLQTLSAAINQQAKLSRQPATYYKTYALSQGTGLEHYGFIIKDVGAIQPVTLPASMVWVGPEPNHVLEKQNFITRDTQGLVEGRFPLYRPDMTRGTNVTCDRWVGVRYPCLALFYVTGAAEPYLPIFVCHFKANTNTATEQMRRIPYISLLNHIAHQNPLSMQINGAHQQITKAIFTGDFNVHYTTGGANSAYNPFVAIPIPHPVTPTPNRRPPAPVDSLGFNMAITQEKTHLYRFHTFVKKSRSEKRTTLDLRRNLYDNFFFGGHSATYPSAITLVGQSVVDVPKMFRGDVLELKECLSYYAALDAKGLKDNPYQIRVKNYVNQLRSRYSTVNLEASLVGARLISDHLPVILEVQLP